MTRPVVVVTGGGQGQGAAFARRLAADGAVAVALDLTPEPIEDLPGVVYRQHDVTDERAWHELSLDLSRNYATIDGLVSNAAVTWRERVTDLAPADLARVLQVNVTGALLGIRALSPLMTAGGSIVLIGSVAGLTGHYAAAYTTSKWALRGLAKATALELAPQRIRVNTVHPGWIETPMSASAKPAFRRSHLAETPMGRLGTVDDIVPLIMFLLSPGASYISGTEIAVDGGMSAHGGVKSISDAMKEAQ